MTAPPLKLQDLVRQLAIRQADDTTARSTAPQPMNIPATESEMGAWMQRGGQLSPNDPLGGGVKYPGGTFGGEFSDADWAAYLDALKKLGHAKSMEHLKPLLAAYEQMRQRPDASAVATSLPIR